MVHYDLGGFNLREVGVGQLSFSMKPVGFYFSGNREFQIGWHTEYSYDGLLL